MDARVCFYERRHLLINLTHTTVTLKLNAEKPETLFLGDMLQLFESRYFSDNLRKDSNLLPILKLLILETYNARPINIIHARVLCLFFIKWTGDPGNLQCLIIACCFIFIQTPADFFNARVHMRL